MHPIGKKRGRLLNTSLPSNDSGAKWSRCRCNLANFYICRNAVDRTKNNFKKFAKIKGNFSKFAVSFTDKVFRTAKKFSTASKNRKILVWFTNYKRNARWCTHLQQVRQWFCRAKAVNFQLQFVVYTNGWVCYHCNVGSGRRSGVAWCAAPQISTGDDDLWKGRKFCRLWQRLS